MIRLALIGKLNEVYRDRVLWSRLQDAEITAIGSMDVVRRDEVAAQFGIEAVADTLEELVAQASGAFDAVVFDLAADTHLKGIQQAIGAGKHCLVAAPLASNLAEAEAIADRCATADVKLMVGRPLRHLASNQTVKARLDEGKLGEPGLLRIHRWTSDEYRDGDPSILPSAMMADIDLAYWFFGRTPTEVFAVRNGHESKNRDESYVQIHLGFTGGGMALMDYTGCLPHGSDYHSLSLIGSKGAAYADDHRDTQLQFTGGGPMAFRTREGQRHFLGQVQEFVDAIKGDGTTESSVKDGLAAVLVAEAAVASARERRAVKIGDH